MSMKKNIGLYKFLLMENNPQIPLVIFWLAFHKSQVEYKNICFT